METQCTAAAAGMDKGSNMYIETRNSSAYAAPDFCRLVC